MRVSVCVSEYVCTLTHLPGLLHSRDGWVCESQNDSQKGVNVIVTLTTAPDEK